MNLHLLRSTSSIAIYYDSWNNWLFADWHGELTLPAVQVACLELGRCVLGRPYARVLNSNVQVTTTQWEVAGWLAQEFLPFLTLAGVEKFAWVCAPGLRGRNIVQTIINRLPLLQLAIFDELDEAVSWLQQNPGEYATGCGLPLRPTESQSKLARAVQQLELLLRTKAAASSGA
ncbi:hypothetical protein [Hymenobacter cheonanensis]|uniref:hypothetical protein n=1 Tax=Hymenobacter sp. CA2-7 TaxID=3063993 RepID=UPI002712275D|nr:hypothetical protein [Hymenobacter sp. CA2-7]MDO7888055.1 hypothetical protein [Hymenobacter sp. CA2-7]